MVLGPHAFFSFTSVTDCSLHRAYNEWHQLDHRPENLALPGVRWGERWVRTPALAASSRADAALAPSHYVNVYFFAPPVDASVKAWHDLAEQSFQWGRRPDVTMCTRPLMGFFDVVKGYVRHDALVSVEALPFRPAKGVLVQVLRFADPHAPAAERFHHWQDQQLVPAMLRTPGVAGVYTFSSVSTTIDDSFRAEQQARTFRPEDAPAARPGSVRVLLTWCDDDVRAVEERLRWADAGIGGDAARARGGATVLFRSAVQPIEPWRWDWFD
jgi:hypothetical protein